MNRVTRLFAVLAFALALSVGAPGAVYAASCTDAFSGCLNDSWDAISGAMADFECTAAWSGCVLGKLKFW